MTGALAKPLRVFIVAGEESGDMLGSALMRALSLRLSGAVMFRGVGGTRMKAAGLDSLYPMDDLTAIGFGAVIGRLPTILRRLRETVEAIVAERPDILVLVDAPDFTHRVAHRVRKRLPDLRIVKYVAPTVWAWRPGRARAMSGSIDHVLALLPFEPEVMHRLGGPPTSYVGHPLLSEIAALRPNAEEAARRASNPPVILVLPGSRGQELTRLGAVFGETLGLLAKRGRRFELVLPTLPRLEARIRAMTAGWPVMPRIVTGEAEKLSAFRSARAALAASGTVTLELALSGVPFVGAYRVPEWEAMIGRIILTGHSVLLANIVLGENAVPEFLQQKCRPDRLANALEPLLDDGPIRQAQLDSFARIDRLMETGGAPAEMRAADIVLSLLRDGAATN
ncbi:lipid-A-disaccharide synthase [Kaistia dalseonensis]|uniref:Lipid-A-disaccharide synthase n=1 Tax=Kaistia dalseonensis TaxID=410840 RepID=A0ABU0H126_9HYPH|nr:lipid-A-disaccharide synthase [Kaistia dalseonensis]MCX5493433.1 lipid-A-disaccharide synthase [Kaistia dalseonensis]MDQ0435992.1 lipid-A-disaccharide synthase [Kaistia dalseonensis]